MEQVEFNIIIISDRAYHGTRNDKTIPEVRSWCKDNNFRIVQSVIIPDEPDQIADAIHRFINEDNVQLILTSGGTGFAPRDITPEVTAHIIKKRTPGIDEYLRMVGLQKTPYAALSRGISGIVNNKLIINFPGNPRAVIENLEGLKKILPHALSLLRGSQNDDSHKIKVGE